MGLMPITILIFAFLAQLVVLAPHHLKHHASSVWKDIVRPTILINKENVCFNAKKGSPK